MSTPPDTIGQRYALGTLLGRGGMGEVREATDLRLTRAVAIKVLRADLAEQDKLRERFEREARAAARINHPNVVAIYDIGEDDGVPFIVMERLPGPTLATELASGRVDQSRACMLGLEILSALDAAHRLGVIHRDIKPANILLDPAAHAKVADFGIAKIAEEDSHTTMGLVFGTASYLAPERLAGHVATPSSDIYAVGVLLFELLAGCTPFQGDTPLALVEAISQGASEPLRRLRLDVDPEVVAVIERAMQRDPADRYESARDMADALEAARNAMLDRSTGDDTIANPIVFATASTGADSDAGETRAMPVTEPEAANETVPSPVTPEAPRRRSSPARPWKWVAAVIVTAAVIVGVVVATRNSNSGSGLPQTPTTASAPSGSIPAPLGRAINDLDKAVSP